MIKLASSDGSLEYLTDLSLSTLSTMVDAAFIEAKQHCLAEYLTDGDDEDITNDDILVRAGKRKYEDEHRSPTPQEVRMECESNGILWRCMASNAVALKNKFQHTEQVP